MKKICRVSALNEIHSTSSEWQTIIRNDESNPNKRRFTTKSKLIQNRKITQSNCDPNKNKSNSQTRLTTQDSKVSKQTPSEH